MTDRVQFVQFPHPGSEHRPREPFMGWNRGDHARKYLRAHGRYLGDGDRALSGEVDLWAEWEPQSEVLERLAAPDGRYPHVLHRPYWTELHDAGHRQNTDPMVFGDQFIYSNCRQPRNQKLRRLAPGSLVLFGSTVQQQFVLDTVLVIADDTPYRMSDPDTLNVSEPFRKIVLEPLRLGADPANDPRDIHLYRGVTYQPGTTEPFSFAPARPASSTSTGFPRPPIDLTQIPTAQPWINPKATQTARVLDIDRRVRDAIFDSIVEQVREQGLVLAVSLDWPEHKRIATEQPGATTSPGDARSGAERSRGC